MEINVGIVTQVGLPAVGREAAIGPFDASIEECVIVEVDVDVVVQIARITARLWNSTGSETANRGYVSLIDRTVAVHVARYVARAKPAAYTLCNGRDIPRVDISIRRARQVIVLEVATTRTG